MILTRTPLRLCLGGGATDQPSYADVYGGHCITLAIAQYVWIAIQESFSKLWLCRYSETEVAETADQIRHPILRAVLKRYPITPQEIVSFADVPSGAGLGSSAAFTVGLLNALHNGMHDLGTPDDTLAEEAFNVEANLLGRPVGRMDQYATAVGGLQCLTFGDRMFESSKVKIRAIMGHLVWLQDHLRCFYVSAARDAGTMLRDQHVRTLRGDAEMVNALDHVKRLGAVSLRAIESQDLNLLAESWREHWALKRTRSPGITTQPIDDLIALGLREGALAGKLQGAGGGGCLLFLTEQPERLSTAMTAQGLREIPIKVDFEGTQVVHRDG